MEFSHLSPNANIIFAEIVKALFSACRYLCHRLGLFLRRAPLFFALLAGVAAITVVDGGYALRAMLVSLAIPGLIFVGVPASRSRYLLLAGGVAAMLLLGVRHRERLAEIE